MIHARAANHTLEAGLRLGPRGALSSWGSDECRPVTVEKGETYTLHRDSGGNGVIYTCGLRPDHLDRIPFPAAWIHDSLGVRRGLCRSARSAIQGALDPSDLTQRFHERLYAVPRVGRQCTCVLSDGGRRGVLEYPGSNSPRPIRDGRGTSEIDPAGTHVCGLRSDGRATLLQLF